jgi:FdhE protein
VALSFLGKWFGKRPVDPALEEVRIELDRLAAEHPAFAAPLRWLREMLPDLTAIPDPPSLNLTAADARSKLADGVPLLRGEQLAIDAKAFRRRWEKACAALEAIRPDGAATALADALRRGDLDASGLIGSVLAGHPEEIHHRAEALGLDPTLAATLMRFALFPVFTALAAHLSPLREGAVWERGFCQTCGSWPLLGEFRGLDQSRYLRCGLCADGWEAARLWCPFCGNRDHERLGFLHAEGEESQYRALTCEECRGYVKMVSALSALPPLTLLAADAATLHLDLAAAERGFLPRSGE